EILPDKKEFRICLGLLAVMYLFMGIFVYGEVLTLSRQIVIWVIYLIIGLIFYWKMRSNRKVVEEISEKEAVDIEYMIVYLIVFMLVGAAISALWVYGYRDIVTLIVWLNWLFFGLVLKCYFQKKIYKICRFFTIINHNTFQIQLDEAFYLQGNGPF
ncbi:MAG: hypothetical protein KAJ22_01835, partial [Candidatus Izimaplasma sp.]|nr:hypothetical protein [Candidatus Izimaplasma bacterium]